MLSIITNLHAQPKPRAALNCRLRAAGQQSCSLIRVYGLDVGFMAHLGLGFTLASTMFTWSWIELLPLRQCGRRRLHGRAIQLQHGIAQGERVAFERVRLQYEPGPLDWREDAPKCNVVHLRGCPLLRPTAAIAGFMHML